MNNTHNLYNYSISHLPYQFSFGSDNEKATISTEGFPRNITTQNTMFEDFEKSLQEDFFAGTVSVEQNTRTPSLHESLHYKEDDSDYNLAYDYYSRNLIQSLKNYNFPNQIFEKIADVQIGLKKDEACYINSSDNNPELFILPDSVLITAKKVGNGTFSSVFRTKKFSCDGSPISIRVVKVANNSYRSEYNLLQKYLNADALNSPYIDHIQACYSIIDSMRHLAIFENSDADLAHADYNKVASPIKFLVIQLKQIVKGIKLFHESNIVHRDIKGENCLINYQGVAKITDTGFAKLNLDKEIHTTDYTPLYAPPFIWNTFQDQESSQGYQGKDADVFSTGITIEYDGIIPLLNYYATTRLVKDSDLFNTFCGLQQQIMNARKKEHVNSKEQVLALGENHPGRVSLIKRVALIFPDRDVLLKDTLAAIQLFAQHLSKVESNCLEHLAKLAYKLINYNSHVIPPIGSVKKSLDYICKLEISENTALKNVNTNTARPFEAYVSTQNPSFEGKENRKTSSPTKTKKKVIPLKRPIRDIQEETTKKLKTHYSLGQIEDHS